MQEKCLEQYADWVQDFMQWLVAVTEHLGYAGLLIMTFIESTVIPLPIEATLIPAGYLIEDGRMAFLPAFIASVVGTVSGAYLNYWLARHYGRGLFIRYGRFFMMNEEKLEKFERFVAEHGAISTFTGRLLPGLRHYITLPAGLARMRTQTFLVYTLLGAMVLSALLLALGYYIGASEGLAKQYMPLIKVGLLLVVMLIVGIYVLRDWRRRKSAAKL